MNLALSRIRPVLSTKNLFREVYFSLLQHRKRVVATVASASIGVFGLVAGIGITRTRDAQTLNRFDALAATQITARSQQTGVARYLVEIPTDAEQRVEQINGVVSAGIYASIRTRTFSSLTPRVRATPRESDAGVQISPAILRAASPGLFPTIQASFTTGRPFTTNHNTNRDRVCVIGLGVAHQLGITSLFNRPSIYIGTDSFEVLGIVEHTTTKPELLEAVILPLLTAQHLYQTDESVV